jgi:RNA polymerase sigma factor (sigma-70 family)
MSAPKLETTRPIEHQVARSVEYDLDRALDIFLAQRTQLFRMAFRVIGDVSGAEDVVQEAWLRWQRADRTKIANPAAFLTTTTTNLAINVIQSARHRHEAPTQALLTDLIDPSQDPTLSAEQAAAVEETLALLMARLNSSELAAYLLRKGFDYAYCDVAGLLCTSVPNARQLVRRAQKRVETDHERPVSAKPHRLLVAAFLVAARTGDLQDLERLLIPDGRPGCPAPTTPGSELAGHRPTSRAA